jgi:predicted O-methyltransferase YrrM
MDVYDEAVLQAIETSEKFLRDGKPEKKPWFYWRTIEQVSLDGLWLEFGTGSGESTANLAAMQKRTHPNRIFYTFDWFQGLPEKWVRGENDICDVGAFSALEWESNIHEFLEANDNVKVIIGLFQDTLGGFLEKHNGVCAFIHVDCDLYSSTKYVLDTLGKRIVPGTVIIFDELYNYPNYLEHEWKAWKEYLASHSGRIKGCVYLARVPDGHQVALKVI